jgi:ATP-dependent Clp protease, protease subunit
MANHWFRDFFMPNEPLNFVSVNRQLHIEINASATEATIKISGYISSWRNSAEQFEQEVDRLVANGINDVTIYINSGGGSVFEAFEIYNIIKKFKGNIKVNIGALAASAATIIACAATKTTMAKNGQYMIHRPMIAMEGNEDEVESNLKALKNVKQNMLDLYTAKTGMAQTAIEKLWKNDYWMNATEAKAKGFIDEVSDETTITPEDVNDAINSYKNIPEAIRALVTITSNKTENPDDMKFIAAKLNLSATATEQEIVSAVELLKAKADKYDSLKKDIEEKEKTELKAKVTAVVDKAIADKKFTEDYRATFTAKLEANFEAANKEIEAIKPVESLLKDIKQSASPVAGIPEERKDWTYADWAQKDNAGLQAIMAEHPESFKALYKKEYGQEPTFIK